MYIYKGLYLYINISIHSIYIYQNYYFELYYIIFWGAV
jgi:hypothetical protein